MQVQCSSNGSSGGEDDDHAFEVASDDHMLLQMPWVPCLAVDSHAHDKEDAIFEAYVAHLSPITRVKLSAKST